jgi:hypothetical protein
MDDCEIRFRELAREEVNSVVMDFIFCGSVAMEMFDFQTSVWKPTFFVVMVNSGVE